MTVSLASRISTITFAFAVVLMTWQPGLTAPPLTAGELSPVASS